MGLPTVLTLIFVVLKLTGNIDWSWWWVCSPLIIEAIIAFIVFAIIGTGSVFVGRRATKSIKKYDNRNYF